MDEHFFSDIPVSEADLDFPSSPPQNMDHIEENILDECSKKLINKSALKFPHIPTSIISQIADDAKNIYFYEANEKVSASKKSNYTLSENENLRIDKLLRNAYYRKDTLKVIRSLMNNPLCFKHNLTEVECMNIMINYYKENDGINDEVILHKYFSKNPKVKKEIFAAYKEFLRDLKKKINRNPS